MRIEGTQDKYIVDLVSQIENNDLWHTSVKAAYIEKINKGAYTSDSSVLGEVINELKMNTGNTDILDAANRLKRRMEES